MTLQDLIEKLKERPRAVEEQLDVQRQEWLAALRHLFAEIERWLGPATDAGVLKISRSESEIVEPDLGSYRAPILRISDGRLTVHLEPVGRHVVGIVGGGGTRFTGLQGRVDLICGPMKIPLVRTSPTTWKAVPLRGEPRDLNEESFAEILSEVLLDE
ncbi:MAG TPA: hypothetical protein VH877_03140 [Polyangia bacterium]|jgi:hypothetical protein|nr:hypothetical protein [Polyangia bacterium]